MNGKGFPLPPWFAPLCEEVERELDRLSQTQPDRKSAVEQEAAALRAQLQGWSQSLAKPDLNLLVREDLEGEYSEGKARLRELEAGLAALDGRAAQRRQLLDPAQALARLHRLDDVLGSGNVTMGNHELSRHIDRIDAYADGRVVMRTSRLGIFEGATAMLARPELVTPSAAAPNRIKPRRRGRMRIDEPLSSDPAPFQEAKTGLDPGRFAGLGSKWFWDDILEIPKPSFWSDEHATEVQRIRLEHPGWTITQLCEHFHVTPPTIRKALRIAKDRAAKPPEIGRAASDS